MNASRFHLFLDQQKRFRDALSDHEHGIWFPPLRGRFEEDNPSNWFISFVPACWGRWHGAIYGVHFDFAYARPRRSLPERIRLAVGVETPMRPLMRQAFKVDVISLAKTRGIPIFGFLLQAQPRKKLVETDPANPIPFNDQSWLISLQRYMVLRPLIEAIAVTVREYYRNGAFEISMDFPENLGSLTTKALDQMT